MNQQIKNVIDSIYYFNKQAGLLNNYDTDRESCFPIEEMLETYDVSSLCDILGVDGDYTPKNVSRKIIQIATNSNSSIYPIKYKEVNHLDKYLDTIVFAFGSIFKLGLSPQQAIDALSIVMEANMQKLSVGQDDQGKQLKPVDFVGPEVKLQEILDSRIY